MVLKIIVFLDLSTEYRCGYKLARMEILGPAYLLFYAKKSKYEKSVGNEPAYHGSLRRPRSATIGRSLVSQQSDLHLLRRSRKG